MYLRKRREAKVIRVVISAGDHFIGNENGETANELEYFRQC